MTDIKLPPLTPALRQGPCAKWTDDCQGKKDYDGRVISVSTRYWGPGHSSEGLCSAHAAIVLNHGTPDEAGYGDYTILARKKFKHEKQNTVQYLVEEWVKKQFEIIVHTVSRELLLAVLIPTLETGNQHD